MASGWLAAAVMGRRRPAPPAPPVVSVAALVDELVRSHKFVGDVEARRAHGVAVREIAAGMGVKITAPDWIPSMTADEAEVVLAHIVAPAQRIEELADLEDMRERELRDAQRAAGEWPMTPAEKLRIFGVKSMHLADSMQGEGRGPGDPAGSLEQAAKHAHAQRIANSIFAPMVYPNE